MNEHPRLRRAMSGLASRDTAADPAAVVARASAIRRRRQALAGGAAVSIAAVLGGVAAFGTSATEAPHVLAPLTESPSATPGASSAEPTAEPSVTPSPVATTVAPTTAATDEPTTEPTRQSPSPTREPDPGDPVPGPGMVLTLDATPDEGTTGQKVVFRARVTDTDGDWMGGEVSFGDGTGGHAWATHVDCAYRDPDEPPPPYRAGPSDETKTFDHVYRKAGTYTVTMTANTVAGACSGHDAEDETKTVTLTVVVTGEDLPTNGPYQPSADFFSYDEGGNRLRLESSGYEEDGVFVRYSVDWGDGSAPTVVDLGGKCGSTSKDGYPTSGSFRDETEHVYAAAGTYDVTVTVVSAGCDGKDEQSGSITQKVTLA